MRTTNTIRSLVIFLAAVVLMMSPALADSENWMHKGYDLAQTHFYPYGPTNPVTLEDYELSWSYPVSSRVVLTADVIGCDGEAEVIAYDEQSVFVFSNDGSMLSSVTIPGHTGYSKPVAGDVTGDGCAEIICGSQGNLWIYDGNANLVASYTGFGSVPYPVCARDLDSDGSIEIVVRDGSTLISIDFTTGTRDWTRSLSTYGGRHSPVGDINSDGTLEIIPDCRSGYAPTTTVVELDDGSVMYGVSYGVDHTSHAIGQIGSDADARAVCFLGNTYSSPEPLQAIVYDDAGNALAIWDGPTGRDIADWVIANFDSDPANELLVCTYWNASTNSDFRLFLIDDDLATVIAQDDTVLNSVWNEVSLCAADLTGDGSPEIVITDKNAGKLRLLNSQLQEVWSYSCPGLRGLALTDLDQDAVIEIVLAGSELSVLKVSLPAVAQISGEVSTATGGMEGVPVDLFDAGGALTASTYTDGAGYYWFDDLNPGDYTVAIVTPLGYIADNDSKAVTLMAGDVAVVNFALTTLDIVSSQRGRGYWMHQVNSLLTGHGNPSEAYDDMCNYMELIRIHFNEHGLNPVNVFNVELDSDCNQRLEALQAVISPRRQASMCDKAKAHLTALLLNMVSGKIAQWTCISDDDATVSQAITYCNTLIADSESDNDEMAKDICEMINEAQSVPAGWIDLATVEYVYKQASDMAVPTRYALGQNCPNPFNPTTDISFYLPSDSYVTLEVYNIMGQRISSLVSDYRQAGNHTVTWNGMNDSGSRVSSGVYFYRIQAGDYRDCKKMMMIK